MVDALWLFTVLVLKRSHLEIFRNFRDGLYCSVIMVPLATRRDPTQLGGTLMACHKEGPNAVGRNPYGPALSQGILLLFFVGQLGYNTTRFPYCQYSFFKFFREILLILSDIYS